MAKLIFVISSQNHHLARRHGTGSTSDGGSYRRSREGIASLVGRLLILVAAGKETSATLATKLKVSPRQVNRYIVQLAKAGWQIERRGVPTHQDYYFELMRPRITT